MFSLPLGHGLALYMSWRDLVHVAKSTVIWVAENSWFVITYLCFLDSCCCSAPSLGKNVVT